MHRYEFIELIIRLSIIKYRDTKIVSTIQDAVERFLTVDLFPKAKRLDSIVFRQQFIYNL